MPKQRPLIKNVQAQKAVIAEVAHVYEGGTWVPSDKDIARTIVRELENRRVLYNDYELEIPKWVVKSVQEMRQFFHEMLRDSREESALSNHIRAMRAACRKFLDSVEATGGRIIIENSFEGGTASWAFFSALGELRSTIGISLALLLAAYDLTAESELTRILPAPDEDDRGRRG
jgi:hypothetical protein